MVCSPSQRRTYTLQKLIPVVENLNKHGLFSITAENISVLCIFCNRTDKFSGWRTNNAFGYPENLNKKLNLQYVLRYRGKHITGLNLPYVLCYTGEHITSLTFYLNYLDNKNLLYVLPYSGEHTAGSIEPICSLLNNAVTAENIHSTEINTCGREL